MSLSIWVRRSLGSEVVGERNRGNALCLSYNGTPRTLLCNSFPVFLCLSFPAYRVKLFYFSSTICPSTRVPQPVTLSTPLKFHPGAEKKNKTSQNCYGMPLKGRSKREYHFVLQTIRKSRIQTFLSGNNVTMENFQYAAKEVFNTY